MRQNQGRFTHRVNRPGDGVRFAGTGSAEKGLIALAFVQVGDELFDGLGLIACGLKGGLNVKLFHEGRQARTIEFLTFRIYMVDDLRDCGGVVCYR